VGFVPNTDFLKANFAELLTPKGHIKVNEHLQVKQNHFPPVKANYAMALCDRFNTEQTVDYPNIFALGDIADINEEKLAQVR
jgi:pyruvate/2-oxoglutarate dehydrogenase complex dihydrolipoamide dehydrogenase (E3) component